MADESGKPSPLALLGVGIFLVAVGIGLYFFFDHVERDGMRIRIHVVVALIYNFLGKWGVLAFFGGIGTLTALFGIKGLVAGKSSSE